MGIEVWVISMVSKPHTLTGTGAWFNYHQSELKELGLSSKRLLMCLERGDKAVIAEALGVELFVDDRKEVLQHFHYPLLPFF